MPSPRASSVVVYGLVATRAITPTVTVSTIAGM
jgi:hypothetical protein